MGRVCQEHMCAVFVFYLSVFLLSPIVQLAGAFDSPSCLPLKNDLPEKPPCSVLYGDFLFFKERDRVKSPQLQTV